MRTKEIIYALVMSIVLCVCCARGAELDMTDDALRTLTTHADNITLTIDINPVVTNYGLRSITLYVNYSLLFEPPSVWPDGTPVSAHAQISQEEAIRTIQIMSELRLFTSATKSYSERRPKTKNTPPPPTIPKKIQRPNQDALPTAGPSLSLQYVAHDEHWYSYYKITMPWPTAGAAIMPRLSAALSGDGRSLVDQLTSEMRSIQQAAAWNALTRVRAP